MFINPSFAFTFTQCKRSFIPSFENDYELAESFPCERVEIHVVQKDTEAEGMNKRLKV